MKKRVLAILLVVSIISSCFMMGISSSALSVQGLRGDINGDGAVNENDAIKALRIAAGIESSSIPEEVFLLCDINGDGYISVFDARQILRAVAGLISLQPSGYFDGFDGNDIFETEEELIAYFNTGLNEIKEERYGFVINRDTEMKDLTIGRVEIFGTQSSNTESLMNKIFETVGKNDSEEYIISGKNSDYVLSVEGQNYVSMLEPRDVFGSRAEYSKDGKTLIITIAVPDVEKADVYDSSYAKVFSPTELVARTETTANSILTGIADGTEVICYKNALLVAEFEVETGLIKRYITSYETDVYIPSAQNGLFTLEDVHYVTTNGVICSSFSYD
ncbi:MAG: dockerin type I repeat-containing protein [Clostridia bacterium]|nr:dockerin type I repeat-containing protein [Clostridia bacterium]